MNNHPIWNIGLTVINGIVLYSIIYSAIWVIDSIHYIKTWRKQNDHRNNSNGSYRQG